jgi:hypothetical protein
MIDRVYVDFGKTFGQGVFLGVEPKMVRSDKQDPKSVQVQAKSADGVSKWTAIIAVRYQNFDRVRTENLNLTLTDRNQPCADMAIGQSVTLEGCELGIMKNERGGFSVFFSAVAVHPALAVAAANGAVSASK